MPSAATMAQAEEDVRDYNLTEEQKAIKAKYPPVNRKYEYLDHTADVQLHAWGDTLEEAFEQCAMAMFGYMTDTGTVEPLQTIEVETQGDDLQSLLFHFLDEWLYKFSADEFFIPREVKVLNIDQRNFKVRSIGWGEEFSLSKHPQGGESVDWKVRWPSCLSQASVLREQRESLSRGPILHIKKAGKIF
ncbi:protein archease isoform X1 [Manis pentadactyla]|uniref:protein archease isoform X1 n=1 Tax=Manis pentadactyla TaxID=143292 RepID=UPI0018743E34|nr:protein archease isoform X1 [Manis pentadactyla]XP_057355935.1 protein archease isoform X1 [Manis pentadactyla]